jgi:hypothetical protein
MSEYQNLFLALAILSPFIVVVLGGAWLLCARRFTKRLLITISIAFVLSFALSTFVCRIPWVRAAMYDQHSGHE